MAQMDALSKIGIIGLVLFAIWLVKFLFNVIFTYVIGPAVNKVDFKSKGKWALVTGCTDGIGKQYARESIKVKSSIAARISLAIELSSRHTTRAVGGEALAEVAEVAESSQLVLAARGCDIVLVSRSIDKLRATAEEIEKDYKVSTKVIQADFCEGEEIYTNIAREITDLEIGTLVNNVGISYSYPEYFLDVPDWEKMMSNLIKANVASVTRVTGLVLPGMVKRGKGVVINIGSASSIIPSPLLTVYAASKAYVDKFTEGLDMEYRKKGIICQCVMPGFVCTNMSGIRRSTFLAPTAKAFVKSAMSLVGTAARTTGYLPHAIFTNVVNFINGVSGNFGVWLVTRSMENTRGRALKKYKKQ